MFFASIRENNVTITTNEVIVIKLDSQGEEVWRYTGKVLAKSDHSVLIEARFNHSDVDVHGIVLRKNDRFLERYYDDRWYNIYEARDRDDDHLKGWYCNVTRPARFEENTIAYVDLALDLLAFPDGRFLILDEDEFEALGLDTDTRRHALAGLDGLIEIAREKGFGAETRC
jgi:protein associated with RNAse G/E